MGLSVGISLRKHSPVWDNDQDNRDLRLAGGDNSNELPPGNQGVKGLYKAWTTFSI